MSKKKHRDIKYSLNIALGWSLNAISPNQSVFGEDPNQPSIHIVKDNVNAMHVAF